MEQTTSTRSSTLALLLLVFFGGMANLATEIIGPRMFASMYGSATAIWAVIISVTLVGLSIGYAMGGRIPSARAPRVLPFVLVLNAVYLLVVSWLVWGIPAIAAPYVDIWLIGTTATAAFLLPSILFGMLTPLSITLASRGRTHDETTTIVGNLYALGTVGGVIGALSAAYFWIPVVGLSLSLRIFAFALVGFAVYFYRSEWRGLAALAAVIWIIPQPNWVWATDDDLRLVAQSEGYYQTVRVYTDDETFIQMHLGPTFQSKMWLDTMEPAYDYAATMIDLTDEQFPDMSGRRALVLGGAGHTMAHALENRGATVTEVEIDPVIVELSDEYFGEIDGDVVITDARAYVNAAPDDEFDVILFDAFDSGTGIPAQLTTREYFAEISRVLKPDGVYISNFIGSPQGRQSDAYSAVTSTMVDGFATTGAYFTREDASVRQNILLVASPAELELAGSQPLPADGRILTDDRNPVEVLFEQARNGLYFRR
ncbi:MAG: fused MFS/spermidine synthase [Chloroflexota bacterium]